MVINMEDILIKRLKCSEKEASDIAQDLGELSDELKTVLDAWLCGEVYDGDAVYHGYSINSLMKDFDMQFTGAILTIDWLIKAPGEAQRALAYGVR